MNKQSSYTCEICSATDFTFFEFFTNRLIEEDNPRFRVVKCNRCGLYSLYPIPSDSDLRRIYNNYSSQGDRLAVEKLRIKKVYPEKIQKIKRYHSNPKILDIGAGLGGFCYVGKTHGLKVIGIELVAEQVKIAKKFFDISLLNISIEDYLAKCDQRFDVVHLHHVLEHLRHPKDTLGKIRNILSPRGIVILEVPNQFFVFGNEMKIKLRIKTPKKPHNPCHHIYFFSPGTLRKLIKASSYNIIELNQISNNSRSFKTRLHRILAQAMCMGYSSRIEAVISPK